MLGHVVRIGLGPLPHCAHFFHQRRDDLGIFLRIGFGGEVELVVVDDAFAVTQGARLQLLFGGSLVRIPDHPGVDAAPLERGAGVGRRQENGLDIGILQASILQRPYQQVVDIGAFVQHDFLALEVLHRLDRRAFGHQDRLAGGRRWFVGDIKQVGACSLGKHRWGFTGHAKVDGADVQAFKQLRAAGELGPLHVHALGREAFFQCSLGLEQHQGAVFLITDPQGLGLSLSNDAEGHSRSKQSDQPATQNDSAHGASPFAVGFWLHLLGRWRLSKVS